MAENMVLSFAERRDMLGSFGAHADYVGRLHPAIDNFRVDVPVTFKEAAEWHQADATQERRTSRIGGRREFQKGYAEFMSRAGPNPVDCRLNTLGDGSENSF
jgi:hypothetical protein